MAIPFVAHDGMFEDNSGFDDSSSFHIETKYFLIQWNGENNEVSEFSLAASQIDINAKYLQLHLQSFHRVKNWLERRGILIRFDNTTLSLIRGMRRRKIRNNAGLIFTWREESSFSFLFQLSIEFYFIYNFCALVSTNVSGSFVRIRPDSNGTTVVLPLDHPMFVPSDCLCKWDYDFALGI